MKLFIHSPNPRPRQSRALAVIWGALAVALTALVAALCVQLLSEGSGAGSAALVAALYLAVAVIFASTRLDARRSCLEIEGDRVTEHAYPLFIHRARTVSLRDVAGFKRIQRGYRRGQAICYVAAVDSSGEPLFELFDCAENRRWMEQLTRLPCDP